MPSAARQPVTTMPDPEVGLCATCRHVRRAGNRRGSVFYRCARAEHDPRFRKYPPLPVLRCAGHEPEGDGHAPEAREGDPGA